MPGQESKAHRVTSLGETPAEARAKMAATSAQSSTHTPSPLAMPPVPGVPNVVSDEIEGFGGGPEPEEAIVEERAGDEHAPTPDKAMAVVRQLSQEKIQAVSERDAALDKIQRGELLFGEWD